LSKASDKQLGYTAYFFTTGFESLKKEPNEEITKRLRVYWENRAEIIEKEPAKHSKEASNLIDWITNCPIDSKSGLELELRLLEACKDVLLSQKYDYSKCIRSLCGFKDVNLYKVVRCVHILLNADDYSYIKMYNEELTALIKQVEEDENTDKKVIEETIALIDDLGRLQILDYQEDFWSLKSKLQNLE
jgi:hypothetical protein